ncbi:MAG TPA: TylF/MycF/NovP-related O-methyltransferase [Solirubrobacterales bacterium]|nr:TylF/MycF/NovP-related O-methyltransferase [Solirubrobacterales bacterium]
MSTEQPQPPPDDLAALGPVDDAARSIAERVAPYTMTGPSRVVALIEAVRYCARRGIPGDFAECGVWRGGSVLAMILAQQDLGADPRRIHLFDTFEGMTEPTEHDTSPYHPPAAEQWQAEEGRPWRDLLFDGETHGERAVRSTLTETGYPESMLAFVAGPVEETLPSAAPESLALLRLDTDWYESTLHELRHLYPRLVSGGVLIIDDYGHWEGCRRAVDEYFAAEAEAPLLQRIDYTARLAIKV